MESSFWFCFGSHSLCEEHSTELSISSGCLKACRWICSNQLPTQRREMAARKELSCTGLRPSMAFTLEGATRASSAGIRQGSRMQTGVTHASSAGIRQGSRMHSPQASDGSLGWREKTMLITANYSTLSISRPVVYECDICLTSTVANS